ncbi:hypothetical protein B0T21DRAFT_447540 [Apiosordaria backusii]|uniref:Uncharacterized protein n=1 Tax=Apiosordaria backusii TaxID=314023 RepID=A0AA40ERN6_9PEZI|nr:hypothetical protein B0T21DRAFT_447540 [Apiosordaria backusii]
MRRSPAPLRTMHPKTSQRSVLFSRLSCGSRINRSGSNRHPSSKLSQNLIERAMKAQKVYTSSIYYGDDENKENIPPTEYFHHFGFIRSDNAQAESVRNGVAVTAPTPSMQRVDTQPKKHINTVHGIKIEEGMQNNNVVKKSDVVNREDGHYQRLKPNARLRQDGDFYEAETIQKPPYISGSANSSSRAAVAAGSGVGTTSPKQLQDSRIPAFCDKLRAIVKTSKKLAKTHKKFHKYHDEMTDFINQQLYVPIPRRANLKRLQEEANRANERATEAEARAANAEAELKRLKIILESKRSSAQLKALFGEMMMEDEEVDI